METGKKVRFKYNHVIYLCTFLACLVPRYIHTFKLHLGIDFSCFTIAVGFVWLVSVRRIIIHKTIEYVFFFIWAAFIVLSIWRAEKLGVWGAYVVWVFTAILFQQIVTKNRDESKYVFIIRALTDALFCHLLIGLYEITSHRYLFEIGTINSKAQYGHVPISMFHNLNDYATFVTTVFPFTIYRFFENKDPINRIYCLFLAVVSLFLIIIGKSRGAILTLLAFLCAGVFMFARKNSRNRRIVIGGIFAFAIAIITDLGEIRTSLLNFIRRNWINVDRYSDSARINLIKNGLYFLKKTFGFGVGAGNLYKWLDEKSIYDIGYLKFIHNWYVEVLVTFGVLFFIIYLCFHGKIMYRLFSKSYGKSRLKTTFFLSFVCFSIVSISSSSNIYSEWVWMYLVVVALFSASLEKVGSVKVSLKTLEKLKKRHALVLRSAMSDCDK